MGSTHTNVQHETYHSLLFLNSYFGSIFQKEYQDFQRQFIVIGNIIQKETSLWYLLLNDQAKFPF